MAPNGRQVLGIALATVVAAGAVVSLAWAQAPTTQVTQAPVARITPPPLLGTDIAVERIDAFDCQCFDKTQQVDAALLGRVRVVVHHVSGLSVSGKLRLEFFNLSTGQMESLEKPVETLGSALPGLRSRTIEFPLAPKLVRKSTGFKATLTAIGVPDSVPANNTKQTAILTCGPLVL